MPWQTPLNTRLFKNWLFTVHLWNHLQKASELMIVEFWCVSNIRQKRTITCWDHVIIERLVHCQMKRCFCNWYLCVDLIESRHTKTVLLKWRLLQVRRQTDIISLSALKCEKRPSSPDIKWAFKITFQSSAKGVV